MYQLIFTLILVVLAGISRAIMDTLAHHYDKSVFSGLDPEFWDPSKSWRNKYRDGVESHGPKFPGSTTVFVWTSDAWHRFQMVMKTCLELAIAINFSYSDFLPKDWIFEGEYQYFWAVIGFLSVKTLHSGIFQLYYTAFKNK